MPSCPRYLAQKGTGAAEPRSHFLDFSRVGHNISTRYRRHRSGKTLARENLLGAG
jgi:hypothetical protein